MLYADVLRDCGYAVATVGSESAALALLRDRRPDLLLLDLQLSDTAGSTLLKSLRKEGLTVPFVVVTGQGDDRCVKVFLTMGTMENSSRRVTQIKVRDAANYLNESRN